jgi:hypothetical protein
MGPATFHDKIAIFRVLSHRTSAARRFLRKLKEQLKRDFQQEEILIVEKDANVL